MSALSELNSGKCAFCTNKRGTPTGGTSARPVLTRLFSGASSSLTGEDEPPSGGGRDCGMLEWGA